MALWNFNVGVNGKTQNVEYLETANRRAKRMKISHSGSYSEYMEGTVVSMHDLCTQGVL